MASDSYCQVGKGTTTKGLDTTMEQVLSPAVPLVASQGGEGVEDDIKVSVWLDILTSRAVYGCTSSEPAFSPSLSVLLNVRAVLITCCGKKVKEQ